MIHAYVCVLASSEHSSSSLTPYNETYNRIKVRHQVAQRDMTCETFASQLMRFSNIEIDLTVVII